MKDIYYEIKNCIKNGSLSELIQRLRGDPTLTYSISQEPVFISSNAFFKSKGGKNSFEHIFNQSYGRFEYHEQDESGIFLAIEIAFSGIFDINKRRLHECIIGETGNKDMCSLEDGDLLRLSYEKAKKLGMLVSLGHTHPVILPKGGEMRKYGALPSCIPFTEENIKEYVKDSSIVNVILESGIYRKYGGDYCEIYTRFQNVKLISNFSWIMSPALDQLAVFEVQGEGKVIFHPWIIDK